MHDVISFAKMFTKCLPGPKSQFTRYRSWNSRMYPVWRDGDPRFKNCWFGEFVSLEEDVMLCVIVNPKDLKPCVTLFPGGEVTFDLKNDAPTLTGARTTFTIQLNFPPNQTVQSDGQVVWARNCTINGKIEASGRRAARCPAARHHT